MPISLQSLLPFLPPEKPLLIVPSPPQTLSLNRDWSSQPARPLSISVDDRDAAMRTCFPALACANLLHFKSGYYNVEVAVGEDEPEEVLLRRFRRAVMKTGIIREFRRRMFFENAQAKKKRKSREAVLKNRNWYCSLLDRPRCVCYFFEENLSFFFSYVLLLCFQYELLKINLKMNSLNLEII